MDEINDANKFIVIEEFQNIILDEIRIAQGVDDGYYREFKIPKTINGEPYNISIDGNQFLTVDYRDQEFVSRSFASNVKGDFCAPKKENTDPNAIYYNNPAKPHYRDPNSDYPFYNLTIRKEYGIISVSDCPECGFTFNVCDNAERNGVCGAMDFLIPGFNDTCCHGLCRCCPST